MGLCGSRRLIINESIPGQGPSVLITAGKLRLSRQDVDQLYRLFCRIDADGSGLISVYEFIVMNRISSEKFGQMCFKVLDNNGSGKIDFHEYLIAVWNYCSMDKEALALFSFYIFDSDGSGVLSMPEFREMIYVIWGNKKNDHVEQALRTMDKNNDGEVSRSEFVTMSHHTPVLLFPAFEMQERLRGNCLGDKHWQRMCLERREIFGRATVFEIVKQLLDNEYCIQKQLESSLSKAGQPSEFAERVRRLELKRKEKQLAKKTEAEFAAKEAELARQLSSDPPADTTR